MRHVRLAEPFNEIEKNTDGSMVNNGRQTESLLFARKHQEKKDMKTGGSKPWQSMLILT